MIDFPQNMYEDLAKMVVWHRKRGKITQQMLADLAGVSRTAVQRLESGAAFVQVDTLWKILKVLNIKTNYTGPLMDLYHKEVAKLLYVEEGAL